LKTDAWQSERGSHIVDDVHGGMLLEKASVADNKNKQTRFWKITGWLQNAIHDMHMDIIG
jgi:hypothetical protein